MPEQKLKFGFNVYNHSPEDSFDYATQHGLTHIEINMGSNYNSLRSFNEERIFRLKKLAKKHHISLSLHLPYSVNIADIIFPIRRYNVKSVKRSVGLAADLKVDFITAHIGNFFWFPHRNWTRRRALDRFLKNFKEIIKLCEQHKVTIALENSVQIPDGSEYYFLGDNTTDFEYVFSKISSSYLKFCLDTGHANLGEGVIEYLEKFQDQLVSVHFHDNKGSNDEHLPVGAGTVPWEEFIRKFARHNYSGPFISECRSVEPHQAAQLLQDYFIKI